MKPVLAKERAFYCKKNIELLRYQFNLIIIFLHFFSRVLFHRAENFFWVGNFLSVDVDFYFGIGLIHNFTHSLNGIVFVLFQLFYILLAINFNRFFLGERNVFSLRVEYFFLNFFQFFDSFLM